MELLQNKLKETQTTLLSNNSTIDSLKQSLAEAQKYSFRAILNNRQSVHHPGPSVPVGYQGSQVHAQTTNLVQQQTSLSQYLRHNDKRESRSRERSSSPYRYNQCALNNTYMSGSKLQDSYVSKTQQHQN